MINVIIIYHEFMHVLHIQILELRIYYEGSILLRAVDFSKRTAAPFLFVLLHKMGVFVKYSVTDLD